MSLTRVLATWFGAGLAPVVPGTFGTLGAVPVYLGLWLAGLPHWSIAVAAGIALAIGVPVAAATALEMGLEDPQPVVIDEVAGYLTACAVAPLGWRTAVCAFVLFRLLDAWKPWPISRLERLPGGWGIMLDDIAAGLAAGLLTWGLLRLLPPPFGG